MINKIIKCIIASTISISFITGTTSVLTNEKPSQYITNYHE